MHRDLWRALVLLHVVQALVSAAVPAPQPWPATRRLPRGAGVFQRGLPTPGDVTDRSPQRRAAGVRAQQRAAAQPAAAAAPRRRPGEAGDTVDGPSRTRRGRRSRARGRRGGVNWRRHGDVGDKDLIIGQLNVQSLKPKLPDIRQDIHSAYGFDILCMCETWLMPNVPDRLLSIAGYNLVRSDRAGSRRLPKGHGGVAIYIRDSTRFEIMATPVTGIEASNLEIVWISVYAGKRHILVASVYRVPKNTTGQLTSDLDDLENQLQHMSLHFPRSDIIVAGDMNCCLLKQDATPASPGHMLSQLLINYSLRPCNVTYPTYRPARSLLDIVATSFPDCVQRSGVTRCHYGSPHDLTRVVIRLSRHSVCTRPVSFRRNLKSVDTEALDALLLDTDWSDILQTDTTTDKWQVFLRIFLTILDTVAPVRRVRPCPADALPLTPDTRSLLASRQRSLQSRSSQYKEINRLCRAAIPT